MLATHGRDALAAGRRTPLGMTTSRAANARRAGLADVVRLVSLYSGFAAIWILATDAIVAAVFPDHGARVLAGGAKVIVFVVASAALLYVLVRRLVLRQVAAAEREQRLVQEHAATPRPLDVEALLRASEEKSRMLSQVVEHCSEAIVIADASAVIEYVNRAAVVASGYERDELIGRHARILLSGTMPLTSLREMRGQLAAGRPWQGHLHNRRKDGSEYVESAIILPLRTGEDSATRYAAIKEDVTAKNRMSDELERYCHQLEALVDQRTAELDLARKGVERTNRARGEFLARMRSDDDLLDAAPIARGDPPPLPPQELDGLEGAIASSDATDCDPPDIDEAAGRVAPAVDLEVLPRLVGNDPDVLAQLQREYIASAARVAGEIREAVAVADWKAVGWLAHRLKSSSRSIGALALGNLCERLEAAANDNESGAIRALIPRFETALNEVVGYLSGTPSGTRVTGGPAVLIVDDDSFAVEIMTRQLNDLNAGQVLAAASGASALRMLEGRDSAACLLLLDLNMPGMDGVELMRHLAALRYAGALVLISGADDRILETAFRLGKAYRLNILSQVQKPVATSQLQALVEQWRGSTPASASSPAVAGARYSAQDLRRAIDAGQLLLHYQPKVSMTDGALKGVEALLRWQHPAHGLVPPGRFVDLAERHGLIDEMTRVLLPRALRETAGWRKDGLHLQVAFNVSMDSLRRVEFSDFVLEEIARAGVAPGDLCLEVTESRLPNDMRAPMDVLTRLRLKGVSLSIDDFGTGHSSLEKLRDMPFDELKIDRGFVHGSGAIASQRAIFMASLKMAHELGMRAVAEGVEDAADWDFVRAAGCDIGQGYFVAKAMPAEALVAWAADWAARRADLNRD